MTTPILAIRDRHARDEKFVAEYPWLGGMQSAAYDQAHADRGALLQALTRVLDAFDTAESNRGCFSCVEAHDCRCPKSRDPVGDTWKGEWKCACGREELEAALDALR